MATNFLKFCSMGSTNGVAFGDGVLGVDCVAGEGRIYIWLVEGVTGSGHLVAWAVEWGSILWELVEGHSFWALPLLLFQCPPQL